jgi:hypothetical protein
MYSKKLMITSEKEIKMNIKVKAGLEVAGVILGTIVIVAGVRSILNYLAETYGAEVMLNGAAFCFTSVAAYVLASILYDIRVARLQYKAKLEEMTKK